MYWKINLFLSVFYFVIVCGNDIGGPKHGKVAVCFLASWALTRHPPVQFQMSDVDPNLCTHIVYAFASLDEQSNTIKSLDPSLDIETDGGRAGYKNLTDIKKNHPHIKVTLSIGGWNEGSIKYSKMTADKHKRKKFIKSVIKYLVEYEFDGLDIMWKYPTMRGGSPEDKENFVTLVKELKEAFLPYDYILTASLIHVKEIMSSAYDLVNLNRYLDLIYVIGYDYYGPWAETVGPLAPLKGLNKQDEKNVEYTIKYMLSFGVSPEKLVLGIPFYGRTFLLAESDIKDMKFGTTAAKKVGFNGPYMNGTNTYGYNEICLDLKNGSNWSYHWDKNSSTPYLRNGSRVISYDNTRSIANKVKLVVDNNIGGIMIWSLDTDDFKGICDMPNDTYVDFIARYNNITKENDLEEAMKNYNVHQDDIKSNLEFKNYETLRDKLIGLSEKKFPNYPLLRTIHQSIEIALEEKEIADAIKKARKTLEENMYKLSREEQFHDTSSTPCVRTCSEVCFYGTNY